MRYKDAGVDIDAAGRAKAQIKQLARKTFNARVLKELGAFGGFFSLGGLPRDAVLVASVDGVGTKLKIAFALDRKIAAVADHVGVCQNARTFDHKTGADSTLDHARIPWRPVVRLALG